MRGFVGRGGSERGAVLFGAGVLGISSFFFGFWFLGICGLSFIFMEEGIEFLEFV